MSRDWIGPPILREGRAYETATEWVICGTPAAEDEIPDDDPRRHNCDAMGCGQDHVLARFPKAQP